jgi:hypothetical protein
VPRKVRTACKKAKFIFGNLAIPFDSKRSHVVVTSETVLATKIHCIPTVRTFKEVLAATATNE